MLSVGRGGTHPYYDRPMVQRIGDIFGWPDPPTRLPTYQFDGAVEDLHNLARSEWHEMKDWWAFLMDLTYLEGMIIQRDFFDYCFPALLIRWWEGQVSREGGPHHESDLYRALDRGQCLWVMMDEMRRQAVLEWMTDAYIQGVDAWSGHLSVAPSSYGPDNFRGPLRGFNALGQSIPILGTIWGQLKEVSTAGRAQWWLVYLTELTLDENQCLALPGATFYAGGIQIFCTDCESGITEHGFLEANLAALRADLSPGFMEAMIPEVRSNLSTAFEVDWINFVARTIAEGRDRFAARVSKYVRRLGMPDFGGPFARL